MKSFYVAFSIHGTNTFITASVTTDDWKISKDGGKTHVVKGREFQTAQSRRPKKSLKDDDQKLHSKELLTKEGKPMRSPPMILRFFNTLEKEGWVVHKNDFIRKHWKR